MKGPFFIFLLLMPAFIVVIFLILVAMQYKQLKALVSPDPVGLSEINSSPESRARVLARLDSFLLAPRPLPIEPGPMVPPVSAAQPASAAPSASGPAIVRNGQDTLSLDPADLNDIIRGSESLEKLQLDYHLSLEDTLLVARNSLPVDRLSGVLATLAKVLRVHGYLNSEMKGYPVLEAGKIYLVPVAAIMNGVPAPPSVLSSKGKLEPREWVTDKQAFDRVTAGLSAIKIRGGRLLLIRG